MKNNPIRGFKNLIGKEIVKIDATGINHIKITTADGLAITISADEFHYGIPVITCEEVK